MYSQSLHLLFYSTCSSNKMASLAVIIGGAAINALIFSGSNYLFLKPSDHDEAERKRHNLAMEEFQNAREE